MFRVTAGRTTRLQVPSFAPTPRALGSGSCVVRPHVPCAIVRQRQLSPHHQSLDCSGPGMVLGLCSGLRCCVLMCIGEVELESAPTI